MLRSLLERVSRRVVLRRRLPPTFGGGRLYVSPEAGGLKYWKFNLGTLDPILLEFVNEFVKPGMSVWDVGANVGLFAFAAAFRAGPTGTVVAFEPDLDNARLLLSSRRAMDEKINAEMHVVAAGLSSPGMRVGRFLIAARSRAANALAGFGLTDSGGCRESRTVPLFALDDLLEDFRPPNLIKIDVEGAEVQVLRGAARAMSVHRPVMLVEVSQSSSPQVAAILKAQNYQMYDFAVPRAQRVAIDQPAWNCLAVPAS